MRILVCGGRDFENYDYLKTVLSALQVTRGQFSAIIHGGARGADANAGLYARRHNIDEVQFLADWKTHGIAAGPMRNRQMLVEGKPDLVVAFRGGRGTTNMVRQARAAKIEVLYADG